MSIAPYLKEIGRGKEGARHLSREQSADLMSQLLDGRLSDLEKGGFALAMRIKGETAQELAGFMDAVQPRLLALHSPTPAVLLPSYNGARKLPNLTPLLAALLAREGVPVLVHGPLRDPGRTCSAEIFEALGWYPQGETGDADAAADAQAGAHVNARAGAVAETQARADAAWKGGQPVFMPLGLLHPGLAGLLALRAVLGLRNPGHTLAKLLPALPGAVRVVNHTHPEYSASLSEFLALTGADAMLLRGTEGEPVADARRLPALRCFRAGQPSEALSVDAQTGPLASLPELPGSIDATGTAALIRAMLAGELPVPAPITRQMQTLLALRQTLIP